MRAKKMYWKKKLNLLSSMYFCCTEKKGEFFWTRLFIQNSEDKNKDRCIKKSFYFYYWKWGQFGLEQASKNTVLANDIKNLEKFLKVFLDQDNFCISL